MSTNTRQICWPTLDRYSIDMFELIDRRSSLSVGISADTWPTPRPICCDRQSLVYRSTVGGLSVDCLWYRSIVNRCFAEIVAVSLPTGDREGRFYRLCSCVVERGCSSNCRHFEYISNAT